MKGLRVYRKCAASLLVAGCLLLLAGCQALAPAGAGGGSGVDLSNASLNFGSVAVGFTKTMQNTVTNNTSSAVTISSVEGTSSTFQVSGLAFPLVLNVGQSSTFNVEFQPPAPGSPSSTISLMGEGGQTYASMTVAGQGVNPGQLSLNPTAVSFSNTKVGGNQSTSVLLTNSGGTDLTVSQATLSGAGFAMSNLALPLTLHAGGTASITVTFAPPGAGNYSGSITFSSNAAEGAVGQGQIKSAADSQLVLPLSGKGVSQGTLSANPSSLSFGSVQVGNSANLNETLTNTGGTSVTISQATFTGAGFSINGLTLPLTLNSNQAVTFKVVFAPTGAGAASGTLSIVSDASNSPLGIALSGTGVSQGALTPNPTSFSFGNVQVGSSKSLNGTLTNSGGTSITISAASATGTGYSLSGLSLPITLSAGQSTSFTMLFNPTAAGAVSGSVTITSNGSNPTLSIPLSGTGVTQGGLSPNPASISFGNVQVGSNGTQSETLTNSGGTSVTISAASATGSGFSFSGLTLPLTLNAGQSTSFTVKFAPSAAGAVSGSLTITSNGSNPTLSIPLSGTGVTQGGLSPNPASIAFGSVQVGSNSTQSETLTNSGGTSLTISAASVTGTGFTFSGLTLPLTLNAGQSTSFTVKFAPSAAGAVSGSLTITSNGSNPTLSIPLSGTGLTQGDLAPNPSSIAFGNVQVGSNSTQSETLTNNGGTSVTISAASTTGTGFSISGLTLPLTLNAGQSTSFTAKFAPSAAGAVSGSITITSNGSNPTLSIPLSGTGVTQGSLSPNPSSIAFGNVQVGSNSTQSETLTNNGGSSVTISAASTTGTGFSISGLTLPLTLNAGQSTSFTVKFAPSSAGAVSGSVTITSNGSNPSLSIALSGTGVTQGSLSPNPSSISFGNVQVGSNSTQSETLTNNGGTSVTISAASTTGAGFSISGLTLPLTLNAGQSTSFTVKFAPSAAGAVSGSVTITSNGSNPSLSIALSGTGVAPGTLSANPTSLAFGNVQVSNSANLSETLTNTGGSSVTISQANVTGAAFSISGLTLPTTLTTNQSVTFTAKFAPTASGAANGTLSIVSNASNSPLNITLSGTGVAAGTLAVSPTTLNFGTVTVGSSASLNGSLTASGSSVTVSSASSTSGEYTLSGITLPATIAAGQSLPFTVTFTPNASGAANASLTFTSNASNSPTTETLTGTGQAAQSHWADLTWNTTSGAVTYNIYRKLPSDSSYTQISSGDATTSYTDNNVTAGTTYDYVVTAVDGNDGESGYSNMAIVTIPTP